MLERWKWAFPHGGGCSSGRQWIGRVEPEVGLEDLTCLVGLQRDL